MSTDNGIEYVFTHADGSESFEIVFERKEVWQFMKMHRAVAARPVSRRPPSDPKKES
jgi:hypothetical protein